MGKMEVGKMVRVGIAAIIIVLVAVWAVTSILHREYSGSNLSFNVGQGSVVVNNSSQEPLEARMRTGGRIASFRVESERLNLRETAKRFGSGRNIYYAVNLEIPPGQTEIVVTRGADVFFVADSSQSIQATVKPQGPDGGKGTMIFAGLVIAGALFYISRTFDHRWFGALRDRVPVLARPKQAM